MISQQAGHKSCDILSLLFISGHFASDQLGYAKQTAGVKTYHSCFLRRYVELEVCTLRGEIIIKKSPQNDCEIKHPLLRSFFFFFIYQTLLSRKDVLTE